MDASQERYFATRGGNDYFRRNLTGQDVALNDHPALNLLMDMAGEDLPSKGRAAVLGGAGGREAAGLMERLPGEWSVLNVDISPEAIEFGQRTFPQVEHHCLSITSVNPFLSDILGEVDAIFVVGVLLWIDRALLSRAVANIDQSLRDGGLLLLSDFLPSTRRKNPIKHSPENFTYKQDYSQAFLGLGTYEVVSVITRTTGGSETRDRDDRRIADHLLQKNLAGLYPVGFSD